MADKTLFLRCLWCVHVACSSRSPKLAIPPIGAALEQFCADRCTPEVVKQSAGRFPDALWRELAALGVLALATPEGDGGALELVAALESLGRAVFPGPLASTALACQLLPEADRKSVVAGEVVVAVGSPPLLPWAPAAHIFVELDETRAWKCRARGSVTAVDTLGGEPWGRVALEREVELGDAALALSLYDIAQAAYLAAAGVGLLAAAAEHARTRTQFGRAIGEFQAVAHPLADCHLRLAAAETLARRAAFAFDRDDAEASVLAAGARLSASAAARDTAFTCHQVFGALGITLEGPVFHVSRRIQQSVAQPPGTKRPHQQVLAAYGL